MYVSYQCLKRERREAVGSSRFERERPAAVVALQSTGCNRGPRPGHTWVLILRAHAACTRAIHPFNSSTTAVEAIKLSPYLLSQPSSQAPSPFSPFFPVENKQTPAGQGLEDIVPLFAALEAACKGISMLVQRAAIAGATGVATGGGQNAGGDDQKKLDVVSNDLLKGFLARSGVVRVLASEEVWSVFVSVSVLACLCVCAAYVPGGHGRRSYGTINIRFDSTQWI